MTISKNLQNVKKNLSEIESNIVISNLCDYSKITSDYNPKLVQKIVTDFNEQVSPKINFYKNR